MVPLASRVRVLALVRRHQYPAIIRAADPPRRRRRCRPDTVSQGKGRHRCLPAHQPAFDGHGPGTAADDVEFGPSQQAVHPGADTWPQPALLQYRHQLSENGPRGEHAHEPAQARMDRSAADGEFPRRARHERVANQAISGPGRWLREEGQGGDRVDQGAAQDKIRRQAGSQEACVPAPPHRRRWSLTVTRKRSDAD